MYRKYLSSVNISKKELKINFNKNITFQKEIEAVLPEDKSSNILDLGCGYGNFLHTLQKRGYDNLYGIEVGKEQNNFLNLEGLNISKVDIIKFLKNDTNKYSLITLFDVLEHFKKDEILKLISFIKKRLSKKGILIVRSPNGEAIFKGSIMYGDFTHETYFTQRSIIQLFKTFNFSSVKVYPVYKIKQNFSNKIARLFYANYVKFYKFLLKIDNSSSVKYFIPTQNLLAIIKK